MRTLLTLLHELPPQSDRFDAWKRISTDNSKQRKEKSLGQPCGRGWEGLRGACKRAKKGMSEAERTAISKESRAELAEKIRGKKSRQVGENDQSSQRTASKQALDRSDRPPSFVSTAQGTGISAKQRAEVITKTLGLPSDFYEVTGRKKVVVENGLEYTADNYGLSAKYKHKDWDATEKSLENARSMTGGTYDELKKRQEDMMRISTAKARGEGLEKPFERLLIASKNDLKKAQSLPSGGNSGKSYQEQEARSNIRRAEATIASLKERGTLPWEKQATKTTSTSNAEKKRKITREINKTLRDPDPKKFNKEKLDTFVEAVVGGASSTKEHLKQSLEKNKGNFQKGQVSITGLNGNVTVNGDIIGDLAVVKGSDIDKKMKGYSLTHIPTGMAIANIQRAQDAKAAAAGLHESGVDWGGNPKKFDKNIAFQVSLFVRQVSDPKFRVS